MKIKLYKKEMMLCIECMILAVILYINYVICPISIATVIAFAAIFTAELYIKKIGHSLCMALIFQICFNFIYDITNVYLGFRVDYMAMACVDFWLIMLLFRYIRVKKNVKIISFPSALILLLLIGFINGMCNPASTLWQAFKGIVMFLRYFSIYLIACEEDYDYYRLFKFLYPICILLILVESFLGFHVDSRNGFFGVYGSGACMLFIGVRLGINLSRYLNGEKNFIAFICEYIFILIIMLITENKAMMLIFNVAVLIALIAYKNKLAKRIGMICTIFIGLLVGMQLITIMYPKFGVLFTFDGIYNYLLGNSNVTKFQYGRFEAGFIAYKLFCVNLSQKLFGLGLGTAFPPENIYHILNNHGYSTYSYILDTLGTRQGYYLSGFSCVLIELGIIGVCAMLILLFSCYALGFKMLRGNKTIKDYGLIMLCIACANTYYMIYGNAFTFTNLMALSLLIMGICKRKLIKE